MKTRVGIYVHADFEGELYSVFGSACKLTARPWRWLQLQGDRDMAKGLAGPPGGLWRLGKPH